ncbi:hypothetical protein NGRA_1908 [Nosema granulosis]|uniref:Uncharacterized protein n=1 Tax=Nosema granulosis TaxID=83296 RepID=A0A9P6GXL5_9MICR|nr:hypothetical protein NGRA_1908 [Nosema granulosis]
MLFIVFYCLRVLTAENKTVESNRYRSGFEFKRRVDCSVPGKHYVIKLTFEEVPDSATLGCVDTSSKTTEEMYQSSEAKTVEKQDQSKSKDGKVINNVGSEQEVIGRSPSCNFQSISTEEGIDEGSETLRGIKDDHLINIINSENTSMTSFEEFKNNVEKRFKAIKEEKEKGFRLSKDVLDKATKRDIKEYVEDHTEDESNFSQLKMKFFEETASEVFCSKDDMSKMNEAFKMLKNITTEESSQSKTVTE